MSKRTRASERSGAWLLASLLSALACTIDVPCTDEGLLAGLCFDEDAFDGMEGDSEGGDEDLGDAGEDGDANMDVPADDLGGGGAEGGDDDDDGDSFGNPADCSAEPMAGSWPAPTTATTATPTRSGSREPRA